LSTYLEALRRKGVKARGILVAPGFSERALSEAARRGIKTVYIDLAKIRKLAEKDLYKPRKLEDYFK
jgi:RecB family endonuclease NucS